MCLKPENNEKVNQQINVFHTSEFRASTDSSSLGLCRLRMACWFATNATADESLTRGDSRTGFWIRPRALGQGEVRNFPYYVPERVERVAVVEPDATMLCYARQRAALAPVPITLVQAPAEALPFVDAAFDCAVATLVFCSVFDPPQALRELLRVLKPGGRLLLVEHVRSRHWLTARFQDLLVPLTTRLAGNCHWNRDTERMVNKSGFVIRSVRRLGTGIQPIIVLQAVRPQGQEQP